MSFPSRHLLSKHQAQFCVGPSSVDLSHFQPDIDQLQASVMKLKNLFCLDYYVLICDMYSLHSVNEAELTLFIGGY